jgi:hypothetical protein
MNHSAERLINVVTRAHAVVRGALLLLLLP